MAQYDKLINLGLLSQFLTKAKTIFAPKITASGILKGDGNGNVSAATAGTDYLAPNALTPYRTAAAQDAIDAGKEAAGLGLTGASVGDLVRVNSVDANGKPTSWKRVALNEIKTNPNLLDNWYFVGGGSQLGDGVFPINQRGKTVYNGAGYGIDRWEAQQITNTSITLNNDGLILSAHNNDGIRINLPFSKLIEGQTYTISLLCENNILLSGTAVLLTTIQVYPYNNNNIWQFAFGKSGSNWLVWAAICYNQTENKNITIKAAKLENGSEQTLAHNEGTEENPVWVLNEIPDYDEELRKCQTSRADSSDAYANQEIATINRNPGAHNSIYRGKYLGSVVSAEQYAAINAGTFEDLYIGDYWTINNVNWRIAAFDYWLHCGDTECTTHHVVVVPDTNLYNAQMLNTSTGQYVDGDANNSSTGAYVGSGMYKANLANAKTIVNNAFGSAHILNHREYLKNATSDNIETAGAWYDSTVELMTEQMVYGGKFFANAMQGGNWASQYTIDKGQLPLFALEHSRICNRASWWLRDVISSTGFAMVDGKGFLGTGYSSYPFGVRPAFGIKA